MRHTTIYPHLFLFLFLTSITPAIAGNCEATPAMHSGTHYQAVTTEKVNMGKGLRISGTIRSANDCKAIPRAKISRWQTNREGVYTQNLYAYMYSDTNGKYSYETEWPGAPIAHIHFIIEAQGYQKLVTQWIGDDKTDKVNLNFTLHKK